VCIDTSNVCTNASTTSALDDYNGSHPDLQEKILTARSKLGFLLRRCLTPAPAATASPQGLQTYRRIQPLALSKVGNPLLRRAHVADSPRASYPAMGIPRRPEYGTLARRIRTCHDAAPWDPEGQPSVGSIAAAGFYYDVEFTII